MSSEPPPDFRTDVSLRDATAQEVQLELIRRRRFNLFEGEVVVRSLLAHRDLWLAVLMDRLPFVNKDGRSFFGMIKLRDLPYNHWNIDTLFVLTETKENAERLKEIAEADDWKHDEIEVNADLQENSDWLGTSEELYMLSAWWD